MAHEYKGYICYDKLWKTLKKKERNKQYLREHGINSRTMASLNRNDSVTTDTIALICDLLRCQPHDIMEYKRAEKPEYIRQTQKPKGYKKQIQIEELPTLPIL